MREHKLSERTTLLVTAAGVIGAIVGAAITGVFNYLAHQNDLDAKMIELSVGILRAEPTTETTPLREWAIDVIDKRANFKFNADQRTALLKRELPFKSAFENTYIFQSGAGTGRLEDRISTLRQRLKDPTLPQEEREVLEKQLAFLEQIEPIFTRSKK